MQGLIEFLDMGGHGFYVWSVYSVICVAIGIELLGIRRRRSQAVARIVHEARIARDGRAR